MQHCPSPLHTLSSDSLSRQDFKTAIKAKTSLKRKQWCGWETMCILANVFSTHQELGLSRKVTRFLVRNILEVVRNGRRETLRRCILGSASGAQEPNSTIMQNIMKTFHRAMKIRKYLRLSRNSWMLSPVLGSLDSSPKPCVPFFFSLKLSTAPVFINSVPNSRMSPIVMAGESVRTGVALGLSWLFAFWLGMLEKEK